MPESLAALVLRLRAEGMPEPEIERIIAASEEAVERNSQPDPDLDALAPEVLTPNLTQREARQWVLRDISMSGLVWDNKRVGRRVLVSVNRESDGEIWLHGSVSRGDRQMPTYDDLAMLHRIFMGGRLSYQLFLPEDEHYTFSHGSREVLHLWAPLTGPRRTPDFRSKVGTV